MTASVSLKIPKKALFVGSYVKVPVEIDPNASLKIDELDFLVPDGPRGGVVSLSRDKEFNQQRPDIMLLVGYEPGTYVLQALKKKTGVVVGKAKFIVNALWPDDEVGPPRWFTSPGVVSAEASAWGGGPTTSPQNVNVIPATGTRRIAILLVDTSSQRFTTDAATLQSHRDRWLDEIQNGVTTGGVTRSLRQFYREVSYGNFDISAQVFGPVQLPGSFDDYFKETDGKYAPKGGYYQACFTAGDGLINYNNFDTLLCVSQSVDGPPVKSAWPYASLGNWGPYTTAEGDKYYGVISMPNEWGVGDDREIYETATHELGHNLGLRDQYRPAVPGRNTGAWEMMHRDNAFPHFSIAHRMMLGWVPAGWVQTFNFASMAAPVEQTITLHPIEQGAPPAGRKAGIEIRLADGWNYYLEYRAGQGTQIGDRNLPTDSRVLGTDVVSPPYEAPIDRPGLLLLNNDGDGDGSVLGNGQDYEETDTTDPIFPTDFKVDVSGIDGAKANVRVRYGVNSRPDPSIRPWPAGPGRRYQSPDIEVRNARNQADKAWFNVPWEGNVNTVIAKVKNVGGLDAPGVRLNFYVKKFTANAKRPIPETFLGADVRDVAKGATVEFSTTWTPPRQGHYCIIARIPLYQLPSNASVAEMTERNNEAQSNYTRFISRTASPASREIDVVTVGNPYPIRTRIFITAGQTNPLYRTYLETAWLTLDPGETRQVRVMYEYALDPKQPPATNEEGKMLEKFGRKPNDVNLAAFIEDPHDTPRHAIQLLGGIQTQVVTGRDTRFKRFRATDEVVTGLVVTADDGKAVTGGKVIAILTIGSGHSQSKEYHTVKVNQGQFTVSLGSTTNWKIAEAYYVPTAGLADCNSKRIKR